ncbi:hypothetical protein [Microtetraspora glauca]|uniref:Uncharacterized protein n=1 Tax=Microtetraspora glauca TaxID=1996 RepID=A0ABV3GA28_MICGL
MTIAPAPYALITPEGDLTIGDQAVDFRDLLGPEGAARVPLRSYASVRGEWAGWVNDCSLLNGMPHNVVGSLVLLGFGGVAQPYAGPVVLTGWEWGYGSELRPLRVEQIDAIRALHADARRAADLDDSPSPTPGWVVEARKVAAEIRAMPTPGITFGVIS